MQKIAPVLQQNAQILDGYAELMRKLLTNLPSSNENDFHTYLVKSRIKSYKSVMRKLREYERNPSDAKHDLAAKILERRDLSLAELNDCIEDLVGLRIVCLFKHEVNQVVQLLRDNNETPAFELLIDESGRPKIDVYVLGEQDKLDDNLPFHIKETKYTSVHILGRPPKDDPLWAPYRNLRCEIQVRTLLEEAWSEVDHLLLYKQGFSPAFVSETLRSSKERLKTLDEEFARVSKAVRARRRAERFDPKIQLAEDYRFDARANIGKDFCKRQLQAYRARHKGKHDVALKIQEELMNRLDDVPKKWRNELRNRLLCDQALEHLYIDDNESVSRAGELYKRVIESDARHFWANFRMAHVLAREGDLDHAIEQCKKATNILEKKNRKLRWWTTTGLHGDCVAYHGTLHFRKAELLFRKAWSKTGKLEDKDKYNKAREEILRAIYLTSQALASAKQENAFLVVERCRNNLAFYATQIGKNSEARKHFAGLERSAESNPILLDTMAWIEYKSGNTVRAFELIVEAKELMDVRLGGRRYSRQIKTQISHHRDIIEQSVNLSKKYRRGEEYWAHDWI